MSKKIKKEGELKDWFADQLTEAKKDPSAVAYGIMLRVAGEIATAMREQGLSQKQLANKLGVSQGWVSRILNAPPNMSVERIVEVAMVLGLEVNLSFTTVRSEIRVARTAPNVFHPSTVGKVVTSKAGDYESVGNPELATVTIDWISNQAFRTAA